MSNFHEYVVGLADAIQIDKMIGTFFESNANVSSIVQLDPQTNAIVNNNDIVIAIKHSDDRSYICYVENNITIHYDGQFYYPLIAIAERSDEQIDWDDLYNPQYVHFEDTDNDFALFDSDGVMDYNTSRFEDDELWMIDEYQFDDLVNDESDLYHDLQIIDEEIATFKESGLTTKIALNKNDIINCEFDNVRYLLCKQYYR